MAGETGLAAVMFGLMERRNAVSPAAYRDLLRQAYCSDSEQDSSCLMCKAQENPRRAYAPSLSQTMAILCRTPAISALATDCFRLTQNIRAY